MGNTRQHRLSMQQKNSKVNIVSLGAKQVKIIHIIIKALSQLCQGCQGQAHKFCSPSHTILSQFLRQFTLLQIYSYYFHPCSLQHTPFSLRVHQPTQKKFSSSAPLLACVGRSKLYYVNSSPMDVTFKRYFRSRSRSRSFLIQSFLVLPHIHLKILIFGTFIFCMCRFLIGLHSVPWVITGLIVVT